MGPHPAVAAVRLAVRRALTGLEPGSLVLVACSGGADSLAVAAGAAFEAPRAGLRAGAVTVDHGLQAGSAERAAALVARLGALGLEPVEAVAVTVGTQGGPEAAARSARYAALAECAERLDAAAVLLGHTGDDQAETVLLGLARGSGARSLAGMPAVSGRYRRPLLDLDRAVTAAACAAQGLSPWEDPHNSDPAYTRVRVRQQALPALERALGPGVSEALTRTARLLRDDADALDAWAERAMRECTSPAGAPVIEPATEPATGPSAGPSPEPGSGLSGGLDVARLAALPAAVRRRVLHRAALAAGSPRGALAAVHVAALDALITDWHGQGPLQLPGGVSATRRCGRLLLGRYSLPAP
jgi:tRNA(Ile)-lysidine synthase